MIEVARIYDRTFFPKGAKTTAQRLEVLKALVNELEAEGIDVGSILRHEDLVERVTTTGKGGWAAYK